MRNSSWFSGRVLAIALASATLSGMCQEPPADELTFTVRVSVDSGDLPFSALLYGGDAPYLARREARRASSVKFTEVPEGIHRLTVDVPGGKRAEQLIEVNAYHGGQREEVRTSVPWKSFRMAPQALRNEMEIGAENLALEEAVLALVEASWPLIEQGNFAAAHAFLRRAVTIDPEFLEGWNNLGTVAERQGFLDEAIIFYRQALHLDAGCSICNMNLSVALTRQQLYTEAVHFGRRAVECNSESLVARLHLGSVYLLAREYRQAIPHLKEAITLNGDRSDTPRLQLAAAYAENGDYGLAAKTLSEWMHAHPGHPKFALVEAAMEEVVTLIDQ